MSYTTKQFDDLSAAIASGQLVVQYGDKKIQYQDLAEMRRLRAEMQAELIAAGLLSAASSVTNQRAAFATFSRD